MTQKCVQIQTRTLEDFVRNCSVAFHRAAIGIILEMLSVYDCHYTTLEFLSSRSDLYPRSNYRQKPHDFYMPLLAARESF